MSDPIERQEAIDVLNVGGAELLRRVLDDPDVVGAEREKYEWGLSLIELYISDMKELQPAQPEPYMEETGRMTDTEMQRRKAICDVAGVDDIGELSDGFHTFNQLYYQRMMLFATIVKQNRDRAWKSLRHEDGELCFGGGWFIVGIDTPEGSYTYHYEDNYFSLFDCEELECSKHWDGHTEKDVTRLLSLPSAQTDSCEGCKHLGKWENEVEYGYLCPCLLCKRRVEDHYER